MQTKQIFNAMNIISWIVFIGYCIKVGAIIIVSLLSFFVTQKATENLYMGIDFSNLYRFSLSHYTVTILFLIVITCLKAYIFYLLIKIFKIIDYNKPFKTVVIDLIFKISYVAISVGVIGVIANSYITWLNSKVSFTRINIDTAAYLFMAGVVFIIASLFKRAAEIQSENELTI
ncbi:DUF2975 domain-containing protein [Psychroserpens sp. SPM9]|uniref:DUF2975 domain-containing protein n=1 Tax=Psychroserpens sp. SPM9 TaxID=2975598 RepID=UPI0021A8A1AE|nr:DUF2975 domain-containing protein [Psychroserpens sp. SPM9]MDG5490488.1 DUF2975 domain-containing protein [Psychroserpens sp. SPM9]